MTLKEKIIEITEKEGREITTQTQNMTIYWDKYLCSVWDLKNETLI